MVTAEIVYQGELRTKITHKASGSSFNTDAPVDNHGKGESISPTDMLAAALGACMQTIIGIYCQERNIPFSHAKFNVNKIMASGPRRIAALEVNIDLTGNSWNEKQRKGIVAAAEACPVAKSLHPDIQISFAYSF